MAVEASYVPKRRGGRPTNAELAAKATANATTPSQTASEAATGPDATPKRRRRASVGGHAMKLVAPARAGYKRRWGNDDNNRLADLDELGYTPVLDTGLQSSSPGSPVSRLVGTKASGEPLRAYLMETPDELHAEGVAEKEALNRQIDDNIRAGRSPDKDLTGFKPD